MTEPAPETGLPVRPAATATATAEATPGAPAAPKATYDPKQSIEPHILAKMEPEFIEAYTRKMNTNPPPSREQMTIEAIRAHPGMTAEPCTLDTRGYPRTAESEFASEDGARIPVRVYYPDEARHGAGPYPVHLNFHGGGFVLGSLATESTMCMSMCDGAGIVVIDVNYRHCPETTWGKCFQDAFAALKWAREEAKTLNVNPDSVSLGGISAGGHITLVLQHLARDAGIPLRLVMPSVPPASECIGYRFYTDSPFASFRDFYRGPVLPWASIRWFGQVCLGTPEGQQRAELARAWPDWWFAPLRATNWEGLAPAFIRTGELDPLRDEGEAYGMRLVAAGNKVTMKRYPGSVHTFMFYPELKRKQEYDEDAIVALKQAHGVK